VKILPQDLDPLASYRLMTGVVVPRPIAWVTTLSAEGVANLAPFSCYSFLSSYPPMIGITIGKRRGRLKDTARNIQHSREFVVHTADQSLLPQLHGSADEYPSEQSELDALGLHTISSDMVAVPRIANAPIAMECRLAQTLHFGAAGSEFVVGEVLAFHIRDGLYVNGKIDSTMLMPIGRLAGPNYIGIGEVFPMQPNVAQGNQEVI